MPKNRQKILSPPFLTSRILAINYWRSRKRGHERDSLTVLLGALGVANLLFRQKIVGNLNNVGVRMFLTICV